MCLLAVCTLLCTALQYCYVWQHPEALQWAAYHCTHTHAMWTATGAVSSSVCTEWGDRWGKLFLNMAVTIYRHNSRDDVIPVAGRKGGSLHLWPVGRRSPTEWGEVGWVVCCHATHTCAHTNTHICVHTHQLITTRASMFTFKLTIKKKIVHKLQL